MPALNLPIHPYTKLRAIGVLPSGRIIWPVLGGNGQGDGGGTGGSGSGSGTGSGSGQGGAGDGGGQGGSGGNNGDGKSSDRTFTQADLERIVGERLTRERSKYGDYDQLRTKAEELDKLKEEQASEAEKATKQAAKDAESRVRGELEPQMLRLEVALAEGLPPELGARVLSAAKRLVGNNRDDLVADAKEFFKTAPITVGQQGGNGNGASFDQGSRGGSGTSKPTVTSGADLYAQQHGKKT